jgi:hypothetical protein
MHGDFMKITKYIILLLFTIYWQSYSKNNLMKVALFPDIAGEKGLYNKLSNEQKACLDYIGSQGYTHVIYHLNFTSDFRKTNNGWKYLPGGIVGYNVGPLPDNFRFLKKEIESRGMKMIPFFESLTHCDTYIKEDPTISEIYDASTSSAHYPVAEGCNTDHGPCVNVDHIAYVGNYPTIKNEPMDQIFGEFLKLIKSNWALGGPTALGGEYPEYICIGHDELGYRGCSRILYRSSGLGSQPNLIAREIAYRYGQIQNTFFSSGKSGLIKILIYGDSFLPSDHGETYGLCGNTTTGQGGVLQILRDDPSIIAGIYPTVASGTYIGVASNTIIVPWIYSYTDGIERDGGCNNGVNINKIAWAKYLDDLKYQWIAGTGEDGGHDSDPNYKANVLQTTFEWARAVNLYPNYCKGYATLTFEPFNICHPTYGCTGFSVPILNYLLQYPYIATTFPPDTRCPYNAYSFSGVNIARARTEMQWRFGTDYTIGLGLKEIGTSNNLNGIWNSDFTEYTLSGVSGDVWGNSDNFNYAFIQKSNNFDIRVKIKNIDYSTNTSANTSGKAGIMIRKSLYPGAENIHFFATNNNLTHIHQRAILNNATKVLSQNLSFTGTDKWLRIVRAGTQVSFYMSSDAITWKKVTSTTFEDKTIFIGLTSASGYNVQGSVTFSNLSIKS